LSGTAFLAYFTQACGIKPPTAWIFSQFIAANLSMSFLYHVHYTLADYSSSTSIASMVLVSSNPTNLVISSASGINFIYFSGWTILPALLSALLLYPLLMLRYFRTSSNTPALVPRRLETPDVYPRGELKDVRGAIFKAALLAATLLALIVSSVLVKGLFVWWVTVPAALIAFVRDVAHDMKHGSVPEEFAEGGEKEGGSGAAEADLEMEDVSAAVNGARGSDEDERADARLTLPRLVAKFAARLPTVYSVTTRLPWPLLPFAFSFFILVESLSSSGWITVWAGWMSKVVQNNDVVAIFFVGWICILLCNVSIRRIVLDVAECQANDDRSRQILAQRSYWSISSTILLSQQRIRANECSMAPSLRLQ